jgi:thioredoxin-like negative regulator of GroEL
VVLVQISSNTCPWCKGAEAVADTLKAAGLSVTKFNSDQDTAVKAKYKPLQFPTWVVENNGVEVNRATGSMTAAALREWVESNRKFIENDGRQ